MDTWIALATLTALEIVLGIDNIIFIAILVGRVPESERARLRNVGLSLALFMRLGLLFAITWIMGLEATVFSAMGQDFSGRDLILLAGGLFLIGKSAHEMFEKLEGPGEEATAKMGGAAAAGAILAQILVLDVVFSIDGVITAVGMTSVVWVMVVATILSSLAMIFFAKSVGDFVERHPSMKLLALSFLLLIGVLLLAEGFGQHISKGYVYFAMAYAFVVELLNMRLRKVQRPVHLHAEVEVEPDVTRPASHG